jgi:4-oxalocrotonate tautomerase family enzyme
MIEGRSTQQKRALVAEITRCVVEIVECDPSTVRIGISEFKAENYGIAGVTVADEATSNAAHGTKS